MSEANPLPRTVVLHGMPRVIDIGMVRGTAGHAERLLDFWVFGIILAGEIGIEVGDERVRVSAGEYYFLPAGVRHRGLDTNPFDCVFCHFSPGPGSEESRRVELCLVGETTAVVNYQSLFVLLEQLYRSGLLDGDELGVQLLAIIGQLAALQRQRSTTLDPGSALASEVFSLLRTQYSEDLTTKAIAARLGYSYAYLERVFRSSYGRSIHQELLKARVQAAAHSLRMGKPIKVVANEVGFADYYYFLKVFKRVQGVTAGAFQAAHRPTVVARNGGPDRTKRRKITKREKAVVNPGRKTS